MFLNLYTSTCEVLLSMLGLNKLMLRGFDFLFREFRVTGLTCKGPAWHRGVGPPQQRERRLAQRDFVVR